MAKWRIGLLLLTDGVLLLMPNLLHNYAVIPIANLVSTNNPSTTGLLLILGIIAFRFVISCLQWRDDARIRNYQKNYKQIKDSVKSKSKQAVQALAQLNNLKKPQTYLIEWSLLQLPFILVIYQVVKEVHGTIFNVSLNSQVQWLGFVIGLGYWIRYKYTKSDTNHINRWTTPAIMFFVSTVANLSIQFYMVITLIARILVETVPIKNTFRQTKFESELPEQLPDEHKSGFMAMLSFMSEDQLRLFGKTITTTLSVYYMFEIAVSLGGSVYTGSPIPQIVFLVIIISLDIILPDKKYGWFR